MSTVATAPTPARPPATCQSRPSACLDECMRRCSSGFSMRPSLRIFFSGGFKGWPCFTCLVAARGGGRHRNSLCDILLRLPACTSRRVGRRPKCRCGGRLSKAAAERVSGRCFRSRQHQHQPSPILCSKRPRGSSKSAHILVLQNFHARFNPHALRMPT